MRSGPEPAGIACGWADRGMGCTRAVRRSPSSAAAAPPCTGSRARILAVRIVDLPPSPRAQSRRRPTPAAPQGWRTRCCRWRGSRRRGDCIRPDALRVLCSACRTSWKMTPTAPVRAALEIRPLVRPQRRHLRHRRGERGDHDGETVGWAPPAEEEGEARARQCFTSGRSLAKPTHSCARASPARCSRTNAPTSWPGTASSCPAHDARRLDSVLYYEVAAAGETGPETGHETGPGTAETRNDTAPAAGRRYTGGRAGTPPARPWAASASWACSRRGGRRRRKGAARSWASSARRASARRACSRSTVRR